MLLLFAGGGLLAAAIGAFGVIVAAWIASRKGKG